MLILSKEIKHFLFRSISDARLLTERLPDYAIVGGVPAKVIRYRTEGNG